jgi:hypothetical protein
MNRPLSTAAAAARLRLEFPIDIAPREMFATDLVIPGRN